jgi:hypothetical protein
VILETAFPQQSFTNAELHEIAEAMTKPAVRKYLLSEQRTCIKAIANGEPAKDESAESYLRRQAKVQGGLAVLEGLLSIDRPVS